MRVGDRLWFVAILAFVGGATALAAIRPAPPPPPSLSAEGAVGVQRTPTTVEFTTRTCSSDVIRSPDVATDGIAFKLEHCRLFRLVDSVITWDPIDFPDNQIVGQVAFAPVAGPARPIFATVTTDGFPAAIMDGRPKPTVDHARSLGIVVSRDGGVTWQPTPGQPEIDGVPFRHVAEIVVSPTFDQDRTLVAFAWGPSDPALQLAGAGSVRSAALFISSDGGDSWMPVWRPDGDLHTPAPSSPRASHVSGRAALSTRFAQDHALVLNVDGGFTPGSGFCFVLHSGDAGKTWETITFHTGAGSGAACLKYPAGELVNQGTPFGSPVPIDPDSKAFVDRSGWVRGLPNAQHPMTQAGPSPSVTP